MMKLTKNDKSDKIILMNDIKVTQSENGSFSDSAANHQHSERDVKDEQITVKEKHSQNFGFFAMSSLQKFFFIFSLLLSVLYIVVFGWLIPCKKLSPPIPNSTNIQVDEKWKMNLEGLSITSNLEAIKLLDSNEYLMMFGYSSSINQTTGFGIIAFNDIDGKILWQRSTLVLPKYCKCDILDLNLDDMKECIIIGEKGYISVINASNGEEYWHKQESYEFEIASIPALIPDYNNDGISDLVIAFSNFTSMEDLKNNNPTNVIFRILSGKNGIVIGSDINIQQCSTSIDKVQLWKKYNLSSDIVFYCNDDERIGNLWSVSTEKIEFMAISHQNPNMTDFEKILKLEQSKKKQYKIHYYPIQKENLIEQDILVVLNDGDIALLDGLSGRKKWIRRFDNHDNIKTVLTGQFSYLDNIGIIISSSYISGTSLISFHLNNGSEIKNLNYPDYFVTSALLLPDAFNGNDGIILKHINMSSKNFEETPVLQNTLDKSQNNIQKEFHFQEEYLITNCIYNENLEFITKSQVTRLCYQNTSCLSEIYTDSPTAFVSKIDDDSYKLILATTSIINPIQEQYESTIVELLDLHLNNYLYDNSTNYTCYN